MNMKKDNNIDPLDMIAAIMPGGVELQEAIGQRDFVASHTLPIDGLEWRFSRADKCEISPKEYLTSLGFVFGEEADDLFINVTLPEGWELEPSDHSMWSYLIDAQKRKRAGVFYKAAFYDRNAHFDLMKRFSHGQIYDHDEGYTKGVIQYRVVDVDKVVFTTKEYPYEEQYKDDYWDLCKAAEDDVNLWLETNYPDWDNSMAYWED